MARKQDPIRPCPPDQEALFADLRRMHRETGMTFGQLAKRCERSASSLSTAVAGEKMPTWATVAEFVRGCGGDLEYWHGRYSEITSADAPVVSLDAYRSTGQVVAAVVPVDAGPRLPLPSREITTVAEFNRWFEQLVSRSGRSLRDLGGAVGRRHTSVRNHFFRRTLAPWTKFQPLIVACGITDPQDLRACQEVWAQVSDAETDRRRGAEPGPSRADYPRPHSVS